MLFIVLATAIFVPNPSLTPGVTRPLTTKTICTTKWGKDKRHVTLAMKKQVFTRYGIPWSVHARYEVDHLVSRELGGDDAIGNLWPQPWTGTWNAHMKDRLENRLHVLVCDGSLELAVAQRVIAADWMAAFQQYVTLKSAGRVAAVRGRARKSRATR